MFLHGTFRESDELDVVDLEDAIAPPQPAPLRSAARFDALHQQPAPLHVRDCGEPERAARFIHHQQHLTGEGEERDGSLPRRTCNPNPSGAGSLANTSIQEAPPPGAAPDPPTLTTGSTLVAPSLPTTTTAPVPPPTSGGGSPPTIVAFTPVTDVWNMSGLPVPTELPLAPSPPPCCTPGSNPTAASS
uniref:Uncharacterized protein n=1 Tax=Anopheles farauti TaxID=69004 RepID=A0A182QQU5_9DIPT